MGHRTHTNTPSFAYRRLRTKVVGKCPSSGGGRLNWDVLVLHSRYLSGLASGENRVVDEENLLRAAGYHVVYGSHLSGLDPRVFELQRMVWSPSATQRVACS